MGAQTVADGVDLSDVEFRFVPEEAKEIADVKAHRFHGKSGLVIQDVFRIL